MSTKKSVKILVVSKATPTAAKIIAELKRGNQNEVLFEEKAAPAMQTILKGGIDCLIFNFDILDTPQMKVIEDVKSVGKGFSVLCFADKVNKKSLESLDQFADVTVFEKNYFDIEKDILGVCARFLNTEFKTRYSRKSKRHVTNQKATLQNMDTGEVFMATICNLSEQGAYVEIASNNLTLNQEVKVSISLDKLGHIHVVTGHVMWVKSSPVGTRSVGVQFNKPVMSQRDLRDKEIA